MERATGTYSMIGVVVQYDYTGNDSFILMCSNE